MSTWEGYFYMKTKKMKNKKRNLIIIFSIVSAIALIFVVWGVIVAKNDIRYTEDINDYNSGKYKFFDSDIFLEEIPSDLEVVDFSYYSYVNENKRDIYLEVKFDTVDKLEAYLSTIKQMAIDNNPISSVSFENGTCFFEEQNPYNKSYIDIFYSFPFANKNNVDYVGYSVDTERENTEYGGCFSIISYSYEELTIVQTYSSGCYLENVDEYIPKYFRRFDIPLTQNHERYIVLKNTAEISTSPDDDQQN